MYTARFEFDADQAFDVAIASWDAASASPLPADLVRGWVEARELDFAIRVTVGSGGGGPRILMALADARHDGGRLQDAMGALRARTGAAIPSDAAMHDAL